MSRKCAYLTIVKVYMPFEEGGPGKDLCCLAGVGLIASRKNNPTIF